MSTLCACTRASKLSLAAASRSSLAVTRSFSTTTSRPQGRHPHAPDYITVPRPKQNETSDIVPSRPKGQLPGPRQIFSDKPHDSKYKDDYLDRTAPLPTNEASRREVPKDSVTDIRRRMADARRRNLAAGLTGLLDRKQAYDARVQARAARARLDSNRARSRPEREEDILTRPTVTQAVMTQTSVAADPERFARAAASKVRTAETLAARSEARRDALMALYNTAQDFIVDEAHLASEVDRLFAEDYFKKQARSHATDAENAWDVWGAPPSLNQINTGANTGALHDWDASDSERSAKRQKGIAEELTGGNMD